MTISAAKPTKTPRWATDGGTQLEPTEGQKDSGWTNGQRPPFNVMNWLQGLIYEWQQYFDSAIDELEDTKLNRDGSQSFTGFLQVESGFRVNANAMFVSEAMGANAAADLDAAILQRHFDNGTHPSDLNASAAVLRTIWRLGAVNPDGFDLNVHRAANDSPVMTLRAVVDAAYPTDSAIFALTKNNISLLKAIGVPTPTGDAKDTARNNTLVARNTPKAWGTVRCAAGAITSWDGFNLDDAVIGTVGGADGRLRVDFGEAFGSDAYAVTVSTSNGTFDAHVTNGSKTGANMLIELRRRDDGSLAEIDTASFSGDIDFVLFGVH